MPDVPWAQVELFHLDEYIGLPADHPASFRRYLRERLIEPARASARRTCSTASRIRASSCATRRRSCIAAAPIDVAFVGIGENGHLAFNDPPADFDTREPYIVVTLDEACRRQQVGEGWFPTLDDVPTQAISMSVRQILEARRILCIVPDLRKAEAVRATVEGPVTPMVPASILQTHAARDDCISTRLGALAEKTNGAASDGAVLRLAHSCLFAGTSAGCSSLSTVINYIDRQTLSVLAPYLKTEFSWSNTDFALVIIAFRVAYAVGQTRRGPGDRSCSARGAGLTCRWRSILRGDRHIARRRSGSFMGCRFLLGLGEAANWPGATKAVSEWFPRRESGWAVALFDSGSSIGGALAPFIVLCDLSLVRQLAPGVRHHRLARVPVAFPLPPRVPADPRSIPGSPKTSGR